MLKRLLFLVLLMLPLFLNVVAQVSPDPTPSPTITVTITGRWRSGSANNTNSESSKIEPGKTLVIEVDLGSGVNLSEADSWLNSYKNSPESFAMVGIRISNTVRGVIIQLQR